MGMGHNLRRVPARLCLRVAALVGRAKTRSVAVRGGTELVRGSHRLNNYSPINAVLGLRLNVAAVQLKRGVQRKEAVDSDAILSRHLRTRVVVDSGARGGQIATVNIAGLDLCVHSGHQRRASAYSAVSALQGLGVIRPLPAFGVPCRRLAVVGPDG
ncbi:hypothetical protein VTK56DRAFT_2715 [Thermocarpiscus australiensis]